MPHIAYGLTLLKAEAALQLIKLFTTVSDDDRTAEEGSWKITC